MLIGNAEIVSYSPLCYLYDAYLAYMRACVMQLHEKR